jgi:hypothetical protein
MIFERKKYKFVKWSCLQVLFWLNDTSLTSQLILEEYGLLVTILATT